MLIESETVLTAFSALREEYQARLPKGSSWYKAERALAVIVGIELCTEKVKEIENEAAHDDMHQG